MIITAILNFLASTIQSLYSTLPTWNVTLGTPTTNGIDNGMVYRGLYYICQFDKYVPIHDGYATWITIICLITAGLFVYRFVLMIINIVRGSGAK